MDSEFSCERCGCCCRSLHRNALYEELHNGDGVCFLLSTSSNLCMVYDERPEICNIDACYQQYFRDDLSLEDYYQLNKQACLALQGNKQKNSSADGLTQLINPTTMGAINQEMIRRFGEGASQMIQAYKGVRYDGHGNQLDYKGRSLKEISQYKLNPKYRGQNVKQQAGFSGELVKEARDNNEAIRAKKGTRTRTTDGQGETNHPQSDHVKVDEHGKVIEGSGSQMKMKKTPEALVDDMVNNKKWDKYRGKPMDIPSEQVEPAKDYANKRASECREQAQRLSEQGDTAKAKELLNQAGKYEQAAEDIRDSGVKTPEAIDARLKPKEFVAKEVLKNSHEAGVEAAKAGFLVSGVLSTAQNIYRVCSDEKDVDQAVKDVIKDTGKAAVASYGIGSAGTALTAVMQASKHTIVRRLGCTSAPTLIVTSILEVGKSTKRYAKGEIDELEYLTELGEKGTGLIASSYGATAGAALGTLILPGIGTFAGGVIGGLVGYIVSSTLYKSCIGALQGAKIAEERRKVIEKMADECILSMQQYQEDVRQYGQRQLAQREKAMDVFFAQIHHGIETEDFDEFFASYNQLGRAFGLELQFDTVEEFDEFMSDEDSVLVF